MGNRQLERQNRSLVRFAKQMKARRRGVCEAQLAVSQETESWRLVLIEDLTHVTAEEHTVWVAELVTAIYEWDASLDIRWRENVKWFLVSSLTRTRSLSSRATRWSIPISEDSDIFNHSSLADFLSDHLRLSSSHGIAYLIDHFIKCFLSEYQGNRLERLDLHDRMKSQIRAFCQVMTGALRLYYGNVDIVGLLGNKHESFLTLIISSRLMEDERLYRLYFWSINRNKRETQTAFSAKLTKYQAISLLEINNEAKKELVEVAAASGFRESVQCLVEFTQIYSLREKVDCILRMQEAAVKEIERFTEGQAPITLLADDMVTLFCYFILKAQEKELGSHLELLSGLVHFGQLESFAGYCLATLEGALMYMEEQAFREE